MVSLLIMYSATAWIIAKQPTVFSEIFERSCTVLKTESHSYNPKQNLLVNHFACYTIRS